MAKVDTKLTKLQQQKQQKIARELALMATLKKGGVEHRQANERMLYLLIEAQEHVVRALIRKAKGGDVKAITEVLDRLYGKAKETIDLNGNVQFSLKDLALKREELLKAKIVDVIAEEEKPLLEGGEHVSETQ